MADWEKNSLQLNQNLAKLMNSLKQSSVERDMLSIEDTRFWHRQLVI